MALSHLVIWKTGYKWIMKVLPPIVVAPVIIVIGLALAPTAIGMASTIQVDGEDVYNLLHFSAALVTLAAAIICLMFFKGIISLMPILNWNYCWLYLLGFHWNYWISQQ